MSILRHVCLYCGTTMKQWGGVFIDPLALMDAVERGTADEPSEETGWPLSMWITSCDDCDEQDERIPSAAYIIPIKELKTLDSLEQWGRHLRPKYWFPHTRWDLFVQSHASKARS